MWLTLLLLWEYAKENVRDFFFFFLSEVSLWFHTWPETFSDTKEFALYPSSLSDVPLFTSSLAHLVLTPPHGKRLEWSDITSAGSKKNQTRTKHQTAETPPSSWLILSQENKRKTKTTLKVKLNAMAER